MKVPPRNDSQREYMDEIDAHDLTFGLGPAGTGKSFLAVYKAVEALVSHRVSKIILVRPAVEAGEKLGFLPGTLAEKLDPYLTPLYDALGDLIGPDKVAGLLAKKVIEVAPLAFMRGRTLSNAFIILDEAQNTSSEQLLMAITRLGPGSKMVVNGDLGQIDLPRNQKSGLKFALDVFSDIEEIGFFEFDDADVVRHKLVGQIVAAHRAWKDAQK